MKERVRWRRSFLFSGIVCGPHVAVQENDPRTVQVLAVLIISLVISPPPEQSWLIRALFLKRAVNVVPVVVKVQMPVVRVSEVPGKACCTLTVTLPPVSSAVKLVRMVSVA